jgi:acyl-CoA synthetase (AMP-forming)/AMP-acid ligase II
MVTSLEQCAAFALKDERLGEVVGLTVVVKKEAHGRITTHADRVALIDELRTSVSGHLAKYKIPDADKITFQTVPLPRGATGKILKRQIRDEANAKLVPRSKL